MADEASILDALSTTVTALTEDPHSLSLHKEHISLNQRTGLDVDGARRLCVQYLAAPESIWIALLENGVKKLKDTFEGGDAEGTLVDEVGAVLSDFEAAEKDYLSIRVLKMHMSFLLSLEKVGMEEDEIRTMMLDVLERSEMDMDRGQPVWTMMRDWQTERIEKEANLEKKTLLISELETLHLDRLQKPHAESSATLDSYSQFVSTYQEPGSYESKLVEASEIRSAAVKIYDRRSKFTEGININLSMVGEDDDTKGTNMTADETIDWNAWIAFERKKVDEFIIKGVYERAIAATARKLWTLTPLPSATSSQAQEQSAYSIPIQTQLHTIRSSLAFLWLSYASTLRSLGRGEDRALLERAVRSIPWSGEIWAAYMRSVESVEGAQVEEEADDEELEKERVQDVFERALAIKGLLHGLTLPSDTTSAQSSGTNTSSTSDTGPGSGGVEDLVRVTQARAAYERRRIEEGDEEAMGRCVASVERGIELIRASGVKDQKQDRKGKGKERDRGWKRGVGDPRLRLEFYLSDLYMTASAQPLLDMAQELWKSAVAHYKSSYLAWTQYIDVLLKANQQHEVRKVFTDLTTNRTSAFIDWPEAIWEAWARFEALYGSLEEEEGCWEHVRAARERIERKRAKDAERERLQYQQYAEAYMNSIAQAPQQQQQPPSDQPANRELASKPVAAMVVDGGMKVDNAGDVPGPVLGEKRKAETDDGPNGAQKKAKLEVPPKRDRENCTVIIANVPASASEGDIKKLFADCGPIRETKISQLQSKGKTFVVAMVEMKSRDDVPAALTKDKKKLPGTSDELSVNLGWKSTLYVTNFPEGADDAQIRELFSPHGIIFETRWPSRKYKSSRRFVYVQFTEPSAAQSALSLHGKELEPGHRLNVYVSNPERRKERTDAGADDREVYIAGLSKNTTSEDLEELFQQFGTIKDVRLATTDYGNAKGFAFVEFMDEVSAQKALSANNHELKGRRISVTIADSRSHAKQRGPTATGQTRRGEKVSRSVRIRGLPKGAQEGLLQQIVEKYTKVDKVILHEDIGEAVVECSSAAEAGKLLLKGSTEPIVYDDATLSLIEEGLQGNVSASASAKKDTANVESGSGSGATSASALEQSFIPRAAMSGKSRPRAGLGSSKRPRMPGSSQKEAPKFVSEDRVRQQSTAADANDNARKGAQQQAGLGQDAFRQMLAGKK